METDAPKFSWSPRATRCAEIAMLDLAYAAVQGQAWSHRPICDRYLRVHDGFGVPVPSPMRPFHGAV